MKKTFSKKLSLEKRSVAILSNQSMSEIKGGYSQTCQGGGGGTCGCAPPSTGCWSSGCTAADCHGLSAYYITGC